jgi:NAD dependent epimerase/dehydratase family enzyme
MQVVIAGGTGSLGRRLADDWARRGDDVTILTRSPRADIGHRQLTWDGRSVGAWRSELEDAIVVNLAGELVDKRPTAKNIELLRRSRVEPTGALVEAASTLTTPPRLWLQMSTLAVYGDAGEDIVDEEHPVAERPPQMPGVARPWEEAVRGASARRLVIMRTGIVLGHGTPAYLTYSRPPAFLGGEWPHGSYGDFRWGGQLPVPLRLFVSVVPRGTGGSSER